MNRVGVNKKVSDEEFLAAMQPTLKYPSIQELKKRIGLSSNQAILDRFNRFIKRGKVVKIGRKYYPNPHIIQSDKIYKTPIYIDLGEVKYSTTDPKLAELIKSSLKLLNSK